MSIATVISWILGNAFVWLFPLGVLVAIIKIRRVLWGETLFYTAGIGFVYSGLMHAYAGLMLAASIGWAPSPFQFELGWLEVGIGLVGILSLWRGYEMRLAATLANAIFLFAAAAQHIQEMLVAHNYAPNNAGLVLWLGDLAYPALFLILAWLSKEAQERHERMP